ncbi:hypothetical protein CVT24_012760 [Panaeolus cyanescens]|uniref:G domain-containing protein n=1 Tax=Panaeolus cyanescens TaxID=181874 RepID=A0A409YJE7_9AGAR|nr:hypothetical protein CVT24_012760 [Panaeolus cyanescens]
MSLPIFNHITISGAVSVVPIDTKPKAGGYALFIMGPTGAGKSKFIESLSGGQLHGISKDQLDGFTQEISVYEITNLTVDGLDLVYIIDTPGFLDRKISELDIISKVNKWMTNDLMVLFTRVIYCIPISDIRLCGSKSRTFDSFKSIAGIEAANEITIMTTMWDTLWTKSGKERAGRNFQRLRSHVFADLVAQGATLERSLNTQESALQIIDGLCGRWSRQLLAFRNVSHPFAESPFIPGLIAELQGRIAQLQAHKTVLEEDLTRLGNTPTKLSDPMLHVVLKERLKEVEDDLLRFESQLLQFGRPRSPLPTGFSTSLPVESTNDVGRVLDTTGADRRDHIKKFAKKMLKGIGL